MPGTPICGGIAILAHGFRPGERPACRSADYGVDQFIALSVSEAVVAEWVAAVVDPFEWDEVWLPVLRRSDPPGSLVDVAVVIAAQESTVVEVVGPPLLQGTM